jgi:hypothetical protein
MEKEEFIESDREMQRLAFNLCDALDSWNCHSVGEAVGDLQHGPAMIGRELSGRIQRVLRRKSTIREYFPDADVESIEREFQDMDALLRVMAKCSGEPRNYREFLDNLILLLKMCQRWSEHGPLENAGVIE